MAHALSFDTLSNLAEFDGNDAGIMFCDCGNGNPHLPHDCSCEDEYYGMTEDEIIESFEDELVMKRWF